MQVQSNCHPSLFCAYHRTEGSCTPCTLYSRRIPWVTSDILSNPGQGQSLVARHSFFICFFHWTCPWPWARHASWPLVAAFCVWTCNSSWPLAAEFCIQAAAFFWVFSLLAATCDASCCRRSQSLREAVQCAALGPSGQVRLAPEASTLCSLVAVAAAPALATAAVAAPNPAAMVHCCRRNASARRFSILGFRSQQDQVHAAWQAPP